ncbi:MAG: type I-C CRISPR-associated protein Cas5 [Opitutales bacterium]|nr:type I-C CRISPR-associated protein Cas5 [Opitutales bacterium]
MPLGIKLHVWGDLACFTRPEMKVERVSYDVITPSAARGILEAIYWKPQFRWRIDRIHELKPIRWTSIRRNEVGRKATSPASAAMQGEPSNRLGFEVEDNRQQRASLLLRDVAYGIEASIKILDFRFERGGPALSETECVGKHLATFERRARSGGHFHQPYFGTREFPVNYEWVDQNASFPPSKLPESDRDKDLGYMLYDMDYTETKSKKGSFIESNQGKRLQAEPRFFRAKLSDGIIDIQACLADSSNPNAPQL